MPDPLNPIDPKTNNYQGINITDATYTAITSGTGLEYTWDGGAGVLLKNAHGSASRNFTFTIPVPSGSALTDIGSTINGKVYAVAAGKTLFVKNADAFRDPTTGKATVDASGTNCSAVAIKS